MLSLDSERWRDLRHAYGAAEDIPELLKQLELHPDDGDDAEPWFSLWSALAHQGDVFQASFAAVPHVVAALGRAPASAPPVFFHFPAWVEICRLKRGDVVEPDLANAYFEALTKLPNLAVAALASARCDTYILQCSLSAIASAKGQAALGEALLELTPAVAEAFLEW